MRGGVRVGGEGEGAQFTFFDTSEPRILYNMEFGSSLVSCPYFINWGCVSKSTISCTWQSCTTMSTHFVFALPLTIDLQFLLILLGNGLFC